MNTVVYIYVATQTYNVHPHLLSSKNPILSFRFYSGCCDVVIERPSAEFKLT